jgi:phosphopantothenoylcysteine decarboxylase/phosphopantothenate--cysteine ligase
MLRGKKILVGVCGSIAAYKSAVLTRLLIKEEAEVKIIMTSSALDFITPLTLSTLSKNQAYKDFQANDSGDWNSHIDLGLWADLFIIAPASANTLAKMASGICDNLLLATYLSARCPVYIAPAMDLDMYQHPATLYNLDRCKSFGNTIISAEHGELASGLIGEGRMAEPESILQTLKNHFKKKEKFENLKVLVTAGPTYESIDPVRFIGNYSTGKMGYAIAQQLAYSGAEVKLVSGPVKIEIDHPNIDRIDVTNAEEMLVASKKVYKDCHVAIFSAAVSDYKPADFATKKIKKESDSFDLHMLKNPDISFELGKIKKKDQINVGFALETENEIENASLKLKKKNFDFIVLNSLRDEGAGFGVNTNKIEIIDASGIRKSYGLKTKDEVAKDIIDYLYDKINS